MKTKLLLQQTIDAYIWTNKLLETLPLEKWEVLPSVLETNALWQAGHLLVSSYYHSILVIKGHQQVIIETMPLKVYSQLFTQNSPATSIGQVSPYELAYNLKKMQDYSISIIEKLTEEDLQADLEPTGFPHPIAKNKLEALDWNIKHTLWHCGQLALIKRVVGERYDFGLKVR